MYPATSTAVPPSPLLGYMSQQIHFELKSVESSFLQPAAQGALTCTVLLKKKEREEKKRAFWKKAEVAINGRKCCTNGSSSRNFGSRVGRAPAVFSSSFFWAPSCDSSMAAQGCHANMTLHGQRGACQLCDHICRGPVKNPETFQKCQGRIWVGPSRSPQMPAKRLLLKL